MECVTRSPKVLIVDDDTRLLRFLDRTLTQGGYSVLTASDGCEVPDMLSTIHIDVLVLDLNMPGMNGWEVIRSVREQAHTRQLRSQTLPKIVVISGRDEDDTVSFVRRLGADAYLTKPIRSQQLLSTLRTVIAN